MGGMAETVIRIQPTKNRNYYDPDLRNRDRCSPSLKLIPFRKNRVGLPLTKVSQVFKEAVEAALLDGCRRLHFFGRL
jgi:hypothetical protein